MEVFENDHKAADMLRQALAHREEKYKRAPGLHVSNLIYCRRKAWYSRHADEEAPLDRDTLTLFLHGHSVHAFLERGQPEVELKLQLAGEEVTGTVDAVEFGPCLYRDHRADCLHMPPCRLTPTEFKSTRKSSAKPVTSTMHYIEQLATYCLGLQSNDGQVAVLHIMGDYREKRTGVFKVWEIHFSDSELADWRAELEERVRQIMGDEPPELPCHYSWECQFCPFGSKRGGPCEGDVAPPGNELSLPAFFQDTILEELTV